MREFSRLVPEALFRAMAFSFALAGLLGAFVVAQGASVEMTDQEVGDAIEEELREHPFIDAHSLDVRVADGVVRITGAVDSVLARDRAASIALTIRGVESVVNQIRVEPPPRRDADIAAAVRRNLARNPATEAFEIEVEVDDGVVTLKGEVDSGVERLIAGWLAKGTRGVVGLRDRITIRHSADRTDAEIEADVEERLRWDRHVDHALIVVDVEDAVVSLRGTVGSAVERDRASVLAHVAGARDVDVSRLRVEFWGRDPKLRGNKYARKTDGEIAAAVRRALEADPRVPHGALEVSVKRGVATLRGVVDNLQARRSAGSDALNTVGVWRVRNHIKVRVAEVVEDHVVAERARQALADDLLVDRWQIDVAVRRGRAYLQGTVDSYYEKARAADIVAAIRGVRDIHNSIVVSYHDRDAAFDPYLDFWSIRDQDFYAQEIGFRQVKADWEIRDEIRDELWWSPFVDSEKIRVDVDGGVATLRGTVDTWVEMRRAIENAREGGATSVVNELEVRHGPRES